MVAHLQNEKEFWRPFIFPALAADETECNKPTRHYWRGAVWAPTNYEIIEGLQANGEEAFATEATEKYLGATAEVFDKTGTVYENYMPEKIAPESGRGDFLGWKALGSISLLIENVMGFRPSGVHNCLDWHLIRTNRHGIERLHFDNITTDVVYDGKGTVTVNSDEPYTLVVNGVERDILAGKSRLICKC